MQSTLSKNKSSCSMAAENRMGPRAMAPPFYTSKVGKEYHTWTYKSLLLDILIMSTDYYTLSMILEHTECFCCSKSNIKESYILLRQADKLTDNSSQSLLCVNNATNSSLRSTTLFLTKVKGRFHKLSSKPIK